MTGAGSSCGASSAANSSPGRHRVVRWIRRPARPAHHSSAARCAPGSPPGKDSPAKKPPRTNGTARSTLGLDRPVDCARSGAFAATGDGHPPVPPAVRPGVRPGGRQEQLGRGPGVFFAGDWQLTSLPSGWMDVDPPDPFDTVSAGRSAFRVADLLALAGLLAGIRGAGTT